MLKLKSSEQGSAGAILIVGLVLVAGLFISSRVPVNKVYTDSSSSVQGVAIEKGKPQVKSNDEKAEVRIATGAGETAVVRGTSGAISTFPLRIDPSTNSLTVVTPSGVKVVAVLPDAAIKNMLASRVMSYVTSVPTKSSLASIHSLVKLEEKNGIIGYDVEGEKEHRFLDKTLFKTHVQAFVSAENGQVVNTEQSFLGRILNKIFP